MHLTRYKSINSGGEFQHAVDLRDVGASSAHKWAQAGACLCIRNCWLKSELNKPTSWGSQWETKHGPTVTTHKPNRSRISGKACPSTDRTRTSTGHNNNNNNQNKGTYMTILDSVWELPDMPSYIHTLPKKKMTQKLTRETGLTFYLKQNFYSWVLNSLYVQNMSLVTIMHMPIKRYKDI